MGAFAIAGREQKNARFSIVQSAHGRFSHTGTQQFAVDFAAEVGTPVVAAHNGVVVQTRSDSKTTCGTSECAHEANQVRIDDGNGNVSTYTHLDTGSVVVKAGQQVCQGELLGKAGMTGWTTGPHLHFHVADVGGSTVPLRFYELPAAAHASSLEGGIPVPGMVVVSSDTRSPCSRNVSYSSCGNAFRDLGVDITNNFSCTAAHVDETYEIEGRILIPDFHHVLVKQEVVTREQEVVEGSELERCVRVEHGTFRVTVQWLSKHMSDGSEGRLMIAAGAPYAGSCFVNAAKFARLYLQGARP